MARIFITGSADGLGQLAAKFLIDQGHQVVLHARNAERGKEALHKVPSAEKVLIADLSDIKETKKLAAEVNTLGHFDTVIHNAGIYNQQPQLMFYVNTLAPYMLTCLIEKPKRLIYMSSGMHVQGSSTLPDAAHIDRINYSDTKFHDVLLSMAAARKWPEVFSNAVNPGWVPTKMGGKGAPDDLNKGAETQVWLAVSNDDKAKVSGRYFHHKKEQRCHAEAMNSKLQDELLNLCEQVSGVRFSE
ncbi:SDR family NAD(P)-dependent oxidoreductase [Cytophaga aurantiaca]|uniref:SDR family NAD(P)-dependent oxidoreductase n=1 Tax=Cytophaga aurantiaca TaxID=29530 RepID=UPI0003811EB4|nr:SDR family NAD(P)-dependent oxidoreductase [Cytophaga aurantiaca]